MEPAPKLESLSARQDLAFMSVLLIVPLPRIGAAAKTAAFVAASLAAVAVLAGVFFRSGQTGFRHVHFAANSGNLDKRHKPSSAAAD